MSDDHALQIAFWEEWDDKENRWFVYMRQLDGTRLTIGDFSEIVSTLECIRACRKAYIVGYGQGTLDTAKHAIQVLRGEVDH
jgi:hypothetical protein